MKTFLIVTGSIIAAVLILVGGCTALLSSSLEESVSEYSPTSKAAGNSTSSSFKAVTLTGSGEDLTRAVSMPKGKYEVTFTIKGNGQGHYALTAHGSDSRWGLVNEIGSGGTHTVALDVGGVLAFVQAGDVRFETSAESGASWTIKVRKF